MVRMAIEDDHAPQEQEPWRAGEARFIVRQARIKRFILVPSRVAIRVGASSQFPRVFVFFAHRGAFDHFPLGRFPVFVVPRSRPGEHPHPSLFFPVHREVRVVHVDNSAKFPSREPRVEPRSGRHCRVVRHHVTRGRRRLAPGPALALARRSSVARLQESPRVCPEPVRLVRSAVVARRATARCGARATTARSSCGWRRRPSPS